MLVHESYVGAGLRTVFEENDRKSEPLNISLQTEICLHSIKNPFESSALC